MSEYDEHAGLPDGLVEHDLSSRAVEIIEERMRWAGDYVCFDASFVGGVESKELRWLLPARRGRSGPYEWEVASQDQLYNIRVWKREA